MLMNSSGYADKDDVYVLGGIGGSVLCRCRTDTMSLLSMILTKVKTPSQASSAGRSKRTNIFQTCEQF